MNFPPKKSKCNNHEHVLINHFYKYDREGGDNKIINKRKRKSFYVAKRLRKVYSVLSLQQCKQKWLKCITKPFFPSIYTTSKPPKALVGSKLSRLCDERKCVENSVRDFPKCSESITTSFSHVWVVWEAGDGGVEWDVFCVSRDEKKGEKNMVSWLESNNI